MLSVDPRAKEPMIVQFDKQKHPLFYNEKTTALLFPCIDDILEWRGKLDSLWTFT